MDTKEESGNYDPNKKKFYIMTAIAYPNGKPHMGHALDPLEADALARYYRLKGENVHYQTGTDEHGKKNWQTAEKEGKTVMQFLDENVAVFRDFYNLLGISNDYFIRTSHKEVHYVGSQALWMKLHEAGDLYKESYKGLYCVGCESYKTEKELENGLCPDHPTRSIETIEEENYFFRLSKWAPAVAQKIESDELKILPPSRKKEVLNFLAEAKDISFSRPAKSMPWGVPVPNDKDHVMYVWCDALSNYVTGPGYGQTGREEEFKKTWPADIQVLGRDILRFHAAYWPAMLMSAGLALPRELLVHGFIKMGGLKMGKSTGNVIEPISQVQRYGVDCFRFYILGSLSLDADGEYSIANVEERINNELVANFSNLCYRSLSMLAGKYDGKIGKVNREDPLIAQVTPKFKTVFEHFEGRDFRQAVAEIMEISSIGNKFFQDKKPWDNVAEAPATLALCANLVKNLSILLYPIMPLLCQRLQRQLGIDRSLTFRDLTWDLEDHVIGKPEILVNRIQVSETIESHKEKSDNKAASEKKDGTTAKKQAGKGAPSVALPVDVSRLNVRVGKIVKVKKHEEADSLYVEEIDVGEQKPRTVVSGLVKFVPIDEMQDRLVCVVCNLKPAKLKGVLSEGMVFAASNDDHTKVELVTPPSGAKVGERVTFEGFSGDSDAQLNPKHKVWEAVQPDLKSNSDLTATYKGVPFTTSAGVCTVKSIANGSIK
eukprot:TRINITY_DN1480_c0_g1_i1.p1 TRINITY_DN1480_c0_g1~~TRINITY_DN1480_c0_g1_i1.p1  ORF type:complete len:715 (+),score=239.77 TRINITY_DN1480_c0_g1_i1:117-2261(+)